MKSCTVIISLALMLGFSAPAVAKDIQHGIHGMKWGSSIKEHAELTKVHEVEMAAYYANSNMVYQAANQPIPGVFYGFYKDQFFAVFIKLRSPDQFSQLERQFSNKHGKPKITHFPESKQTVYRWKDADVRIKLKMKETIPEYKLAIYYAPLAAAWNQEILEKTSSEVYDKSVSPPESGVKAAPLLDY